MAHSLHTTFFCRFGGAHVRKVVYDRVVNAGKVFRMRSGFTYTKNHDGTLIVTHNGEPVLSLKGERAAELVERLKQLDVDQTHIQKRQQLHAAGYAKRRR